MVNRCRTSHELNVMQMSKQSSFQIKSWNILRGEEREINFLSPYFLPHFSPPSLIFFGLFSPLLDFSPFSLISCETTLQYLVSTLSEEKENIYFDTDTERCFTFHYVNSIWLQF